MGFPGAFYFSKFTENAQERKVIFLRPKTTSCIKLSVN